MQDDDFTMQALQELQKMSMAILGKLEAVQVGQDAIVGVLLKSIPPMADPLQSNHAMLAAVVEKGLDPLSLESFRVAVKEFQQGIEVLR